MGAAVLLSFLDGLRADLSGALVDWYSSIPAQLPVTLGAPGAESPGQSPARLPNGWQSLADLQSNAQDVLTVLASQAARRTAGRPRRAELAAGPAGGRVLRGAAPDGHSGPVGGRTAPPS
ncbi:hypothetical protein LUW77_12465 [Streptomyces radiopugnans]|nr:hypothetical protein LUW77_12465 [Streptomyces radiopugnans]